MATNLTREDMERMMSMNPNGEIADSEEEKIDEETIEIVYPNTAKERVEQELDELHGKILKLVCFLYGRKIPERVVTPEMRELMKKQLRHMQAYAETLQDRLIIWDLYKNEHKE
nr:MAG TPA: hypothetical protein [Caudoviricetes sp.]